MRLGLDLYSIRSQPWDAMEKLDYCDRLGVDVAHFGLGDLGTTDPKDLAAIKAYADDLGLELEVGMGSICETSVTFNREGGSAIEQTQRALEVAAALGSPVLKVLLGNAADRQTTTPLAMHIENCIATCRGIRDQAMDLHITLAVENHAGDLQGWELRDLIERAGPEYVGACLDPGNSVWAIEDPLVTFEQVTPYIVASHIRDSVVWLHPDGAAWQWVALGQGNVGIETLAARYKTACPDAAFTLEVLTGSPARVHAYLDPAFWTSFPEARAAEFARFERLVRRGQPYTGTMVTVERGDLVPDAYGEALRAQQLYDVERSIAYARDGLGMGEKHLT